MTALATTFLALPARADLVRFSLPNGLDVVLAPDRKVPKVVVNVVYDVGAKNEPAGRSGFAHLFEHLMFMGTKAAPSFDAPLSAVGVENNAWTYEDKTRYFEEGPSSALPVILSLEADRMANLADAIDEDDLSKQRAVVLQEMRETVVDEPKEAVYEELRTSLFPAGHPYSRSVIGSVEDLQAATLADVRSFFDRFYAPNNATLLVVGDFDPTETRALVERLFGPIPRGSTVETPAVAEPGPTLARIEATDRVAAATLVLAWTGPRPSDTDAAHLDVAVDLLADENTGLLRRRLVEEERVAGSVWAGQTALVLGNRFEIEIEAADNVSLDRLEAAARAALADILGSPLAADDVRRTRDDILLDARSSNEDFSDRSERIADALVERGDPARALVDDPSIVAATPEAVAAAMRRWLRPERASTARIMPGPRRGLPDVLAHSSGAPEPLAVPKREGVVVPILSAGPEVIPALPAVETRLLSNGVTLEHVRLPDAAFAYLGLLSSLGTANDERGREGRAALAVLVATRGAGGRDAAALGRHAKDIGAVVSGAAAEHGSSVYVSVPPSRFADGAALLADVILKPRFSKDEWDNAVDERATDTEEDRARIASLAGIAARALVFGGKGRPFRDESPQSLEAVRREDARGFYARTFSLGNSRVLSVGPAPIEAVAETVETAFRDWKAISTPAEARDYGVPTFPAARRVVIVPEPGATQTAIVVALPSPGLDAPERLAGRGALYVLAGDFESRLNMLIREERGYSYGVSSDIFEALAGGVAMVNTAVDRDQTAAALSDLLSTIEGFAALPVTEAEHNRFALSMLRDLAGLAETSNSLFHFRREARIVLGRDPDTVIEGRKAAMRLPVDTVGKASSSVSDLGRALIVLAGDPDTIKAQLARIGLEAETYTPPR